jgi:hypothetical protein
VAVVAASGAPVPAGTGGQLTAALVAAGLLEPGERSRLETGAPVITVLPADDRDLSVFGAVRVNADGNRLVAWVRDVERYHRSRYVSAVGWFSNPPALEDVAGLTLDDEDLDALRGCDPGDCEIKLSGPEIVAMRQAIGDAPPGWQAAAQDAFRALLLARAQRYLAHGLRASAPYHDHRAMVSPAVEFSAIARTIGFAGLYGPHITEYLERYPHVDESRAESFLYWSKEALGGSKPIVSITHMAIFHGSADSRRDVVIAAKQVFASHYLTGSLSLSAITRDSASGARYLVYVRRSRADVLGGAFGGIVRRIVERRVRGEAPAVLDGLRNRLESGEPRALPDAQ